MQTQGIAQWLRQRGLARRTAICPINRLAATALAPLVNPGDFIRTDQKLILAVGTNSIKGFDRLVAAFAGLQADFLIGRSRLLAFRMCLITVSIKRPGCGS